MKKLVIELDGSWVLAHRDDDELPVSYLANELAKVEGIEVKESSLTELTVVCGDSHEAGVKTLVWRLFGERYPDDDAEDKVTIQSVDEGVTENAPDENAQGGEKVSDQPDPSQGQPAGSKLTDGEPLEGKHTDEKASAASLVASLGLGEKVQKSAAESIEALVGAHEFKALASELTAVAEEVKRTGTFEVFTNRCYLFSIGDGCGLTTYLNLFAKLIEQVGLCKLVSNPVREVRLGEYKESIEPFESAYQGVSTGGSGKLRVLCVDISEWMDKTENRFFKQFLRYVERYADDNIVIFRVPFVDKDVLSRIRYSLADLVSVRAVSFPPFGREEIKQCAEIELKKYNFTITKSAWKYFFDRISEEKSDGKFYGVNTVKKVVRELVYQKHLTNAHKAEKSAHITVNDAKALCGYASENLTGMEMLNRLVGVDGIKKRVEEIIAQIELSVKDGSSERPCIHMRFVGNPGTGKTTVARIIGKILKEKGILRVGAFFEYSGRDFCGRYVGETAPKTSGICRDAYGSVLFVDEAYSLYRGEGSDWDYGKEAIDTLIAEMENHRNDFVIIMAGYTDDIDKLMRGNLGLESRMPYKIEFPNFTREQLYDIFVSMVKEKFKYDKGLFDTAHRFFTELPEEKLSAKEFSNARFVRNLFERTWAKAALRCQLNGKTEVVLTRDDFDRASSDQEFANNLPKKTKIGFNN